MKNKYGYEVGDYAIIVVDTHHYFKRGDVIKLRKDDGSYNPFWDKIEDGVLSTSWNSQDRVVDYGQIKPCNKYGWSVGNQGVVIEQGMTANLGDVITLAIDDNSTSPFWYGATKGFTKAALNYSKVRKLTDSELTALVPKVAELPTPTKPVSTKPVTGYKFKVDSPKQSKRLQKVLFKLGYGWACTQQTLNYLDKPHLYADPKDHSICYTSAGSDYFDKCDYQLVDIDWLKKLK